MKRESGKYFVNIRLEIHLVSLAAKQHTRNNNSVGSRMYMF